MKKVLGVLLLIVCLSFSALAGHTTQGDKWCECNDPENCSGLIGLKVNEQGTEQDPASELRLLLLALTVLALRYKY